MVQVLNAQAVGQKKWFEVITKQMRFLNAHHQLLEQKVTE